MITTRVNEQKNNFIGRSISGISMKGIKDTIFASTKEQINLRNKCILIGIIVIILLAIAVWRVPRIIRNFNITQKIRELYNKRKEKVTATETEADKAAAKLEQEIKELEMLEEQERLKLKGQEELVQERLASLNLEIKELKKLEKQELNEMKRLEKQELNELMRQKEWKQDLLELEQEQEDDQKWLDNQMKKELERQEKRKKLELEMQETQMLMEQGMQGMYEKQMMWLDQRRMEQEKKRLDVQIRGKRITMENEILEKNNQEWLEHLEWKKQKAAEAGEEEAGEAEAEEAESSCK
ncbi:hypothetical protein NEPAR06_2405 [Nematocida parisii]|uniref:Uncharacterized protein n=1 Tax=Nematocida parisii (strain ERTm3) TaxID=935791 RepID=I3EF91_NEMP3|nr:uncharacterized protein NEPG_02063 [Nematocida parisii ERTm1]EIJ87888.1 hypothetical protein NEQG_01960 [Nematocida parisii ERTm3]KAI5128178.1 hypothetical protein NEPAR08_1093 [Nematocida parisii]EIJ93107.1 hypothetical protein NEPG_02063 [Nematocida parisii ERTm1]KAI5128375.1 hypothetical protein NEPAR03_1284 [Nematocida parisii]KAI5141697.1 hypothetical protein NEPAR04_1169 [Nematocida parisii]|eukprot:XP_013059890.1 hypothetical protein NEPG_02063 [Nematocida parisii ERTm1]